MNLYSDRCMCLLDCFNENLPVILDDGSSTLKVYDIDTDASNNIVVGNLH